MMVCTSTNVFGTEVASLNTLEALKQAGHRLLAITSSWSDGEFGRRLGRIGVDSVAVPLGVLSKKLSPQALWWTGNALARAPLLWLKFHRAVASFAPEVLLLTNPKQGLWLYRWTVRHPTFLFEHSIKRVGPANRWMYRQLNRSLAGFLPVSQYMQSHLEELGVPSSRTAVVYNCLNTTHPEITPTSPVASAIRVGIVGQIASHKGHDVLAEAMAILRRSGVEVEAHVFGAGSPEYIESLKERVQQFGLSNRWYWRGYVSESNAAYREIDICVVPSQFDEPFGMVAIEAGANALPVVASNRGGLPEIVDDGVTGFVVNSAKPEAFADTIQWLATNRDAVRRFGEAGRAKVLREFSSARHASELQRIFESALRPCRFTAGM